MGVLNFPLDMLKQGTDQIFEIVVQHLKLDWR